MSPHRHHDHRTAKPNNPLSLKSKNTEIHWFEGLTASTATTSLFPLIDVVAEPKGASKGSYQPLWKRSAMNRRFQGRLLFDPVGKGSSTIIPANPLDSESQRIHSHQSLSEKFSAKITSFSSKFRDSTTIIASVRCHKEGSLLELWLNSNSAQVIGAVSSRFICSCLAVAYFRVKRIHVPLPLLKFYIFCITICYSHPLTNIFYGFVFVVFCFLLVCELVNGRALSLATFP
ncbi:uncharacterized protein LOC132603667 [Lycium barbarum]|uniref:uncharacterized protein LOC132603667 n=1 Tax=Lycium barbarum TaxID=112863 RepID=UPI00293F0A85|nr:uncharacterized protein LOC132603667 [Lycium barbarum]